MNKRLRPWLALPALGLSVLLACDSVSPVAPEGTILTISANPSRIASGGVATVRAVARKANGTPVAAGTIILFTTTLGSIDPSVAVDGDGEAIATLSGEGEIGTATVTASTGSAEAATVDVQIGFVASSITLQATPSSVPETGGEVDLLAIVRDDQGRAMFRAGVNFKATVGSLESGGAIILTSERGEANDRLAVTDGDIDSVAGDTFQVEAEVGSGGSLLSTSATLAILRLPSADFTFGTDNLTVVFTDTSTGNPTSWLWDFGDNNNSTQQNPTHTYTSVDTYVVTLRATNSLGSDSISKFVSVSGQ